MNTRVLTPQQLVAETAKLLQSRAPAVGKKAGPEATLEVVVELLYRQRSYFWVGIYVVAGDRLVQQSFRGPKPLWHAFAAGQANVGTVWQSGKMKVVPDISKDQNYCKFFGEVRSEIIVPIKRAGRVVGVIDVESHRRNAFAYVDQVLLRRVAMQLARFFTADGRLLLRKLREAVSNHRVTEAANQQKLQPASERPEPARRAAGAAPRA